MEMGQLDTASEPKLIQVLLVITELKKYNFILLCSTDLDRLQLTALTLMQTVCWLIERGREKGE
jgi:hypothetical protein